MFRRLLSIRPISVDFGLLILRLCAGGFMLSHGLPKLMTFSERAERFSDPLHVGSTFSLALVVLAEVFCAVLVALGAFTRLALTVLVINMTVIAFVVHSADAFGRKELALLYLVAYLAIFFAGPGRYSMDNLRK